MPEILKHQLMNLKMKSLSGILMLALALFVFSCNNQPSATDNSTLIAKKWSYHEFKMNEEIMSGEQMGNPTMEFFTDGTYKVEFGPMSDEGTWKITGDELETTSGSTQEPSKMKIESLTAEKCVLQSEIQGNTAFITLIPVSAN